MKKDRLYFLTFLSIAATFFLVAFFASKYFVKVSANQLIEAQVESGKREANEIASFINFQLKSGIEKDVTISHIQKTITNSQTDNWFISVFNWSGKVVCHPDITKVNQPVNSNKVLLSSLKEKNNSDDLYYLLEKSRSDRNLTEVIHISPIKSSDLIVATNINMLKISNQMNTLKKNFYLIFLFMGILVIVLTFIAVRIIGSRYEKQLELKNSTLTSEVVNLSKLNTDLVTYKEKVTVSNDNLIEGQNEKGKKRILTYVRNELRPTAIEEIAYIYTENTITYVVCFDGKKSTTNLSLDDMFTNLDSNLFFRANRQFIISITAIDKIIKYGKSQLKILLQSKTAEEIIISKNKAAEFKKWLNM